MKNTILKVKSFDTIETVKIRFTLNEVCHQGTIYWCIYSPYRVTFGTIVQPYTKKEVEISYGHLNRVQWKLS